MDVITGNGIGLTNLSVDNDIFSDLSVNENITDENRVITSADLTVVTKIDSGSIVNTNYVNLGADDTTDEQIFITSVNSPVNKAFTHIGLTDFTNFIDLSVTDLSVNENITGENELITSIESTVFTNIDSDSIINTNFFKETFTIVGSTVHLI